SAQVDWKPRARAVTSLATPDTSTGVLLAVFVRCPSWPAAFSPQHFTPPPLVIAHVKRLPAAIAVALPVGCATVAGAAVAGAAVAGAAVAAEAADAATWGGAFGWRTSSATPPTSTTATAAMAHLNNPGIEGSLRGTPLAFRCLDLTLGSSVDEV